MANLTPQLLNKRQKRFVRAYVANGGNATQAAIVAGYTAKPDSAAVRGSVLLSKPYMRDAIDAELRAKAQALAPMLVDRLMSLATGAEKEEVQLRATLAGLDRFGWAPSRHVEVNVDHKVDYRNLPYADLVALAAKHVGNLPATFARIPILEADYEEVEAAPAYSPALADKLADIISADEGDACLTDSTEGAESDLEACLTEPAPVAEPCAAESPEASSAPVADPLPDELQTLAEAPCCLNDFVPLPVADLTTTDNTPVPIPVPNADFERPLTALERLKRLTRLNL